MLCHFLVEILICKIISYYSLLLEQPSVVIPVAYEIIRRLSSFVRNIDFALDWMVIDAGKSLYRYLMINLDFTCCLAQLC